MGGVFVGPNAVSSLILVHRAERNAVFNTPTLGRLLDANADRQFPRSLGRNVSAVFVKEVNHVGIAMAKKGQKKGDGKLSYNFPGEAAPAAIDRVIGIYNQSAIDIDKNDSVLVIIGYTENPHVVRDLEPFSVRQDLNVITIFGEVTSNPSPNMIGK